MKKSFHIYRIELMSWNTYRRIFRRVGARAIHVLKITYVKKVEYISEFLFGICWWTWKANIYLKNCWSEPIKNKIILISTMLHLKIKKTPGDIIILHLCNKNLDDMVYISWDIERDRMKLVVFGHFLPFYPLKSQKIKVLKKWKTLLDTKSFYKWAL